jgi:hypothetical protein
MPDLSAFDSTAFPGTTAASQPRRPSPSAAEREALRAQFARRARREMPPQDEE